MGTFAARSRSVYALDHFEVLNIADLRLQVVIRSTTECIECVKRPPFVDLTRGRDILLETLVLLCFFFMDS